MADLVEMAYEGSNQSLLYVTAPSQSRDSIRNRGVNGRVIPVPAGKDRSLRSLG